MALVYKVQVQGGSDNTANDVHLPHHNCCLQFLMIVKQGERERERERERWERERERTEYLTLTCACVSTCTYHSPNDGGRVADDVSSKNSISSSAILWNTAR